MENSEEIFDLAQKLNEKGVRVRVGKHRSSSRTAAQKLKEELVVIKDKKHKIEPEMYIKARMKYEKEYGYCMYDVRFSMAEEKTKPKLTSGWKRHTEIFAW